MRLQPLIIYKSENGVLVKTLHFPSVRKATTWLRSEGCEFSNKTFVRLDNARVTLTTPTCEYEVESDPIRTCVRSEM